MVRPSPPPALHAPLFSPRAPITLRVLLRAAGEQPENRPLFACFRKSVNSRKLALTRFGSGDIADVFGQHVIRHYRPAATLLVSTLLQHYGPRRVEHWITKSRAPSPCDHDVD